jgi:predicted XRE-type DNA-binding protein
MIRTESEYKKAVRRLQEERRRLLDREGQLRKEGLSKMEIANLLNPLRSFHVQLEEEVTSYERLCRGDIVELNDLAELGHALVALRIVTRMSQRTLAKKLGVHESQVSRDERNEYHGITVDRAMRVLEAMGVRARSSFETGGMTSKKTAGAHRLRSPRTPAHTP